MAAPTPASVRAETERRITERTAITSADFAAGRRRAPQLRNAELSVLADEICATLGAWRRGAVNLRAEEVRVRAAYAGVRRGRIVDASDAAIELVRQTTRVLIGDTGEYPSACWVVAAALETAYPDAHRANGSFVGPLGAGHYGDPAGPHSWILTDTGLIIDPTAAQFGHYDLIRLAPGDPRQTWYHRFAGDEADERQERSTR